VTDQDPLFDHPRVIGEQADLMLDEIKKLGAPDSSLEYAKSFMLVTRVCADLAARAIRDHFYMKKHADLGGS